jgi:hypothetical protein
MTLLMIGVSFVVSFVVMHLVKNHFVPIAVSVAAMWAMYGAMWAMYGPWHMVHLL